MPCKFISLFLNNFIGHHSQKTAEVGRTRRNTSCRAPDKAISHLTDFGDCDLDHLARLYNMASPHAVDTMFMQIRRRVMMLEIGIHSQGNRGRVWHGYAPYNPKQIVKMLTVFRAVRNFVIEGEDKMTSAMRLGLSRGPVRYKDILYFMRS